MTPVECIARLCALVPPRYPLTRFHGVLGPRAKLRPRIVPRPPDEAARACPSTTAPRKGPSEPGGGTAEWPLPRPPDRSGPVVPAWLPASATTLARTIDAADVVAPNILSTKHLDRIGGGFLRGDLECAVGATLLARTFDIDVKACARCGGRLAVRAVVSDHDIARRILDALPVAARAPPPDRRGRRLRACVRVVDREPRPPCALRAPSSLRLREIRGPQQTSRAPSPALAAPHPRRLPTRLSGARANPPSSRRRSSRSHRHAHGRLLCRACLEGTPKRRGRAGSARSRMWPHISIRAPTRSTGSDRT